MFVHAHLIDTIVIHFLFIVFCILKICNNGKDCDMRTKKSCSKGRVVSYNMEVSKHDIDFLIHLGNSRYNSQHDVLFE